MSRIGSKRRTLSFTLIEVMVTVSVLSFGILLLYHSFFISVDSVQYASNRLNAQIWLDVKAWEEKDAFARAGGAMPTASEAGVVKLNGRDFIFQSSIQPLEADLYTLTLALSWKESGKERSLFYATYLIANESAV
ncbi:MAG: prepilin-type N-terminal cleavage/methylation domain-containing protein [Candidatus Omnitrophota bacterium]